MYRGPHPLCGVDQAAEELLIANCWQPYAQLSTGCTAFAQSKPRRGKAGAQRFERWMQCRHSTEKACRRCTGRMGERNTFLRTEKKPKSAFIINSAAGTILHWMHLKVVFFHQVINPKQLHYSTRAHMKLSAQQSCGQRVSQNTCRMGRRKWCQERAHSISSKPRVLEKQRYKTYPSGSGLIFNYLSHFN